MSQAQGQNGGLLLCTRLPLCRHVAVQQEGAVHPAVQAAPLALGRGQALLIITQTNASPCADLRTLIFAVRFNISRFFVSSGFK